MNDKSVPSEKEFWQTLEGMVKDLVKEQMENVMELERQAFLEEEGQDNKGNGFYQRNLETQFGKVDGLEVPRDREGNFSPALFEPYRRRVGQLESMVIKMYSHGMSTRKIADLLEDMYGDHYSSSTVSRITDLALEEVNKWKDRPLKRRYSVLFLDAMTIDVRRDTVANEVAYFAAGIDEDGYREVLSFQIGGNESATVWGEVLEDIKDRGAREVLLVVTDDLSGIKDTVTEAYPKADYQQCVVHKTRNTRSKIRENHKDDLLRDLKRVYNAPKKSQAKECFSDFKEEWNDLYPKVVESWEEDLPDLLTFLDYPDEIRSTIYTTNWLERAIKEMRRRTKTQDSFPSPQAAEKTLYLRT
ncbi:MAG: IS256 family transposase, partial [Candidatus Bipolaricaulia bacterium]